MRTLIAAQLIALLATCMIFFASMVLVEEKTHSSAQMGMMIFSSTLPGFLFALPAGVMVDRHNRVRLLMVGNLVRVGIALGFMVVTFYLSASRLLLVTIYATNLVLSSIAQVSISSEGSLIPRIVKQERLLAINSIIQASMLGAQGAGIVVLAPLLFRLGGAPLIGGAAGLLCAFSAGLCSRLPASIGESSPRTHGQTWRTLWADLRAGWRFMVTGTGISCAIAQLVLASMLSLILLTLVPGWASRGLGVPVQNVPYLAVPGGIGFGLGMWLIGGRGYWLKEDMWASIGLLGVGAGLGALPTIHALKGFYVPLYLLVSTGIGMGFALVAVSGKTILQEGSPDAMRGRIISTQLFLSSAASTLPLPLMGRLADVFGFRRIFGLLAFIALSMGIVSVRRAVARARAPRTPSPRA